MGAAAFRTREAQKKAVEAMKIAKVPAIAFIGDLKIPLKRYGFFFPEEKTAFTLWELKEIVKEMEKMEKWNSLRMICGFL